MNHSQVGDIDIMFKGPVTQDLRSRQYDGHDKQIKDAVVAKNKDVLTTGQVAKICKVAPRTVSKWFDSGQLRGYRIPGSKDRRIPIQQLIRFMKVHNIPMEDLEMGASRLLILDNEPDITSLIQKALSENGDYEVRIVRSAFEAGLAVEQFRPNIMLVDVDLPDMDTTTLNRCLDSNAELQEIRLVAMGASITDTDRRNLLQSSFHNTLAKPFTIRQLTKVIEDTLHNHH